MSLWGRRDTNGESFGCGSEQDHPSGLSCIYRQRLSVSSDSQELCLLILAELADPPYWGNITNYGFFIFLKCFLKCLLCCSQDCAFICKKSGHIKSIFSIKNVFVFASCLPLGSVIPTCMNWILVSLSIICVWVTEIATPSATTEIRGWRYESSKRGSKG